MAAAHLDDGARQQVFAADLTRPFCVSNSPVGTATETQDRFILNGDWPFVTGVLEAEWVLLAGLATSWWAPLTLDGPLYRISRRPWC